MATDTSGTPSAGLGAAGIDGASTRRSDRLAFAHDASHYLLVPEAVVTARDTAHVADLVRSATAAGLALTFRSGGTSLSGQAGTRGILVDTRRGFREVEVLDGGARVRVQPGATVRAVNARHAAYSRKLGPDPASESACTIGGVVANNSSGMACGTELNTYRTLDSAVLVLASGTTLDTGAADADDRLRTLEPELYAGLARLRDRVRADPDSVERIRTLYSIKNTMGYGVNTFLDHTRPVDLLTRLAIGSEGTLAFVAEATFRTVPAKPRAATALLYFPDLSAATGALPRLVEAGFAAIELLDATSLRVAQRDPKATADLRALRIDRQAALLVEHQEQEADALEARVADAAAIFADLPLAGAAPTLTTDPASRAALWHIRKGLYATVAGARPSGTTALLEDIAVPVARLLPTCEELTELFDRHGYTDSVIFGHAKDGNIHFLLNEDFERPELLDRYIAFTDDMVDLVLGHDGTLKAEHGTGRVMAPYVRRQYGDELYDVMRETKRLLDPHGVLNPGVLLDDDPQAHVRDLKSTPTVEVEVDRCVECGYCEPVCPSKDLTTTPRRRIVLRREIARARAAGDAALAAELEADFEYDGIETCAVDGMCATACPVLIDTGDLTRRLRAERHPRLEERAWSSAAKHWEGSTRAAARALDVAAGLPDSLPRRATAIGRRLLGDDRVPAWSAELPGGGRRRTPRSASAPRALYFPACVSTMFGSSGDGAGVQEAFLALCERAGVEVVVPEGIGGLCCGTPWKSKGLADGYSSMRERVAAALREVPRDLPVVVDASSCTEGLVKLLDGEGLRVVDAVEFADEVLLPLLPEARRVGTAVVHRTCSSTQLGVDAALLRLAAAVAEEVVDPDDWGCCAFAGDRGLLHPELTASATRAEAAEVAAYADAVHVSLNRTCELGMSRATGRPYVHVLEALAAGLSPGPRLS